MNLFINENLIPIDEQPFEIVERKGLGHPDTIADGVAESISIDYSRYCQDKFGVILHHNVDKISILGGLCELDFGFGKMRKPINLILNGRMSEQFGTKKIDISELQITSAKNYLQKVLPKLDVDKWLKIHSFVSSSSRNPFWFHPRTVDDLPEIHSPYANDTASVVGFWPLSTTEKIVLECEKFFYTSNLVPKFNFIGQDIKIMAIRQYKKLDLIMCIPFFATEIQSSFEYEDKLEFIQKELLNYIKNKSNDTFRIKLYLNTEDQRVADKTTSKGYYFVVTGSALDYGEEGVAGRGNRFYGFISSIRPYSIESIHGKNPVYHVGKVYAYIANVLSKKIATELECEVNIILTTRNGDPLYNPYSILVNTSKKMKKNEIQKIIERELEKRDWTKKIIENKIFLPINNLNYEKT
jgi:S-adenosylmethionine synthetase